MSLDPGTCAFCGITHLGETGDESTQYLHSGVRVGEPGNWSYETFPGAKVASLITWCGGCIGGLKHKYQRYDETNLRALLISSELRLQMDGLRWAGWGEQDKEIKAIQDDPAIHLEKLHLRDDIELMRVEQMRRAGFDLTQKGWRP